jgi:pimeloyl-ACP methyl ester carboxylesterase
MDVTAQRQADAYRSKKKEWILAPHGRATHSFFWQGPGHWNVEAAVLALHRLTAVWHSGRFQSASNAAILTGHSNGGYGALLFAALHPDRAIGPP